MLWICGEQAPLNAPTILSLKQILISTKETLDVYKWKRLWITLKISRCFYEKNTKNYSKKVLHLFYYKMCISLCKLA